MNCYNYSDNKD